MIVDHINNLKNYQKLHPTLSKVVEYLETLDYEKLVLGKNVIDGVELFVLKEEYLPRPLDECNFERHEKYLDIQYVYEGFELMGYESTVNVEVPSTYDEVKDVEKCQFEPFTSVRLTGGMFALVYPQDWHMPKLKPEGCCNNCQCEVGLVKKLIFKIKI